jgi:NDP-sugar pyrophosphorylase family protein
MKAMLFAAGLGTRLKPLTDHLPKALVTVNGKTLLERNIKYLQRFGITDLVINVHHFAAQVEQVLQNNNGFGSRITISDERDELLETGGGLKKAATFFNDGSPFVVMNADVLTNLDLGALISAHHAAGGIATLAVMKRESSRHFLFNEAMQLCGWKNNRTGEERISRPGHALQPFAFSGIQALSPDILKDMPFSGKFSLVDLYLHHAKTQTVKGYDHTGDNFIDVGKPESIQKAELLFP